MKIAHLTTVDLSLKYLVFPQLTATRDLGIETIGISAPGPWVADLEAAGIRHIPLRSSTRGMSILADIRSAIQLTRILRRERLDILHTHNPKPGLYGRILGRLAGVPVVVNTVHGIYATPDDPLLKRTVVYTLEAVASRFSDIELVQSSEDVTTMTKLWLAPRNHIKHLGNGVDLTRFAPDMFSREERRALRQEFAAGDDHVVIGIVGRMVAEKGYPELIEAFSHLDDRFVLVCIGPTDVEKADALQADAIVRAESDGIHFLGMRTDVDRLYQAMDIFVLPSHREGFPRSAMEAAASGLPIVTTDIRGCRDVVEDGNNGVLVPVNDPVALATAITLLGEDSERRTTMGQAGRARAIARFDEAAVVQRVVDTYRSESRKRGLSFPALDPAESAIRPAHPSDAAALAYMHRSGINTGFLPSLGPRFMRRLYRALIEYPSSVVLVADDGNGPIGFVAGVANTGHFYSYFIRHHGLAAGLASMPAALTPSVISRVWESLRYEGAEGSDAELLATAILPSVRGRGLGTRLGAAFLEELNAAGVREVRVVVGSDNNQAISSYKKMGFSPSGTIEVHAGEQSDVLTWSA